MTGEHAQHVVIASLFAAGVIDGVGELAAGHAPSIRVGLGLTIAGVLLTAISDSAPTLAAGFAVLVLVSSLFTSGLAALADIRKALA
jgi:hypothetical protein